MSISLTCCQLDTRPTSLLSLRPTTGLSLMTCQEVVQRSHLCGSEIVNKALIKELSKAKDNNFG